MDQQSTSNPPHTAMATRLFGNRYAALASDTFLGDGSHLADDSVVAFAFYNIGIQNKELLSAKWQMQWLSAESSTVIKMPLSEREKCATVSP